MVQPVWNPQSWCRSLIQVYVGKWRRRRSPAHAAPAYALAEQAPIAQPEAQSTPHATSTTSDGDKPPHDVTYRALLLNRNFRFLWIGEAVSTFGNYFTRLAVPFFVWQLTGSYTQLGIARALPLFAALLFGLLTGALVDRWDRRRTMIYADLASGALLALLFVLMGQPLDVSFKVAALYAASFVAEILRSIFAAARVAIMPDVVRDDELLAANALDQSTTQFAEVVSYPLIGLALWVGPTLSFGVDAATFLLSALLLWRVAVPHTAPAAAPGNTIWADIGAGLRVTRQLPLVRRIVILSLIAPAIFSLMFTLQLPYAVDVAGSTEAVGFPALEGAMAFGFMIGALLLGRWGQRAARGSLLAYGLAGMGVALLLQGSLPWVAGTLNLPLSSEFLGPWTPLLLLALPTVIASGMTNSLVNTGIRTVVQEQTPRASLGRVFSVLQVAASVSFAVGALFTTVAEGRVALTLTMLGVALLVIGIISRAWLRQAEHTPPASSTADVELRA